MPSLREADLLLSVELAAGLRSALESALEWVLASEANLIHPPLPRKLEEDKDTATMPLADDSYSCNLRFNQCHTNHHQTIIRNQRICFSTSISGKKLRRQVQQSPISPALNSSKDCI